MQMVFVWRVLSMFDESFGPFVFDEVLAVRPVCDDRQQENNDSEPYETSQTRSW